MADSTPKPLRVLLVGGGIGGLTAAIALRMQGHDVQVFEKSRLNTELGNAVFCAPNCTVVLDHLGINLGKERGVVFNGSKFLDADCNVLDLSKVTDEERAGWLSEWYFISRVDLHNALKRRARDLGVTIQTSASITSIDAAKATITLVHKDNHSYNPNGSHNSDSSSSSTSEGGNNNNNNNNSTTISGDLIVGADGVHSATREGVAGHKTPVFSSGACCYRFLVPMASLRAAEPATSVFADGREGVFIQCAAKQRRIIMYPCASGETMNIGAIVPTAEVGEIKPGLTDYDQVANKKNLRSQLAHFAAPVQRLLDLVPDDGIKLFDLLDMEDLPSLIRDKAVLIGDAGHPFQPHLGQGAAQAIEDACVLGIVMSRDATRESIPARLELWQSLRQKRVLEIMAMTRARMYPSMEKQSVSREDDGFFKALERCIRHNAWTNAEEQLKIWEDEWVGANVLVGSKTGVVGV